MVNSSKRNVHIHHNEAITARPRILFPAESKADVDPRLGEVVGIPRYALREFTSDFFQPGTKAHEELEATVSKDDRSMLKGLVILRCAYLADDPIGKKQFAEATKLVIRDYPGDAEEFARAIRDVREPARRAYRTLLEGKIKPARIVILPDFTPALRCPSLSVAMFAFAAYRGVVVCPNCQKLFAVDSERVDGSASERYCTVACGSRYRQKVYRLNAKREKRKRKGKR